MINFSKIPVWFRFGIICLVASTHSLFPVNFNEIKTAFTQKIKSVTLSNGLRLVMMKRENSPTAALYIKFRVGAVDEIPEQSGTAHLLEHMLFKGTGNVGTRDYALEKKYHDQIRAWGRVLDRLKLDREKYLRQGKEIPESLQREISVYTERMALLQKQQAEYFIKNEDSWIYDQNGQVGFNAYTNQDVTNYQIELPVNRMEIWAKLEADRLQNPVLREFYTERDVVIEERRMRVENSGQKILFEKFLQTAFPEHPYGKPVIGYASVIPYLDQEETEEFFRKHYSPDNMVISIVGDIDFEETEQLIKKYFSALKPSGFVPRLKQQEDFHSGQRLVTVTHDSGPLLILGWKKPPVPHPDNAPFEILSSLLGDGASSRLYSRLVLKDKTALDVGVWNGYPGERYTNLFMVYCKLDSRADYDAVKKVVLQELQRIAQGEVSEQEVASIRKKSIADFFRGMDKNSSFADYLSYYEMISGDWRDLFGLYERIEKTSTRDLQRVAEKYLTTDNLTEGRLVKVK